MKKRQRSTDKAKTNNGSIQSPSKRHREKETPRAPSVGMKLDMCDQDNIWSSAKIVKVEKNKQSKHLVTVRYDGWGSQWDETVTFENNERIVRMGTYTKRLKCMVDLLPKRGKNSSTLWPCVVHVRSPNPLIPLEDYYKAEQFLREEYNIFIQPYGKKEKHLPDAIVSTLTFDDGLWINVAQIRMWRKDTSSIKGKAPNFDLACACAQQDGSVKDNLPFAAFDKGTLIRSRHRKTPYGYIEGEEKQSQKQDCEENDASSVSPSASINQDDNSIITDDRSNSNTSDWEENESSSMSSSVSINHKDDSIITKDCSKSSSSDITTSHQNCNDQPLSEYEKLRARNIERNNKRMVELGLITEEEANISNQKAWGISDNIDVLNDGSGKCKSKKKARKRNMDVSETNNQSCGLLTRSQTNEATDFQPPLPSSYKLVVPQKSSKMPYWDYFMLFDRLAHPELQDYAICRLCRTMIKKNLNAGALTMHLKCLHKTEYYESLVQSDRKNKTEDELLSMYRRIAKEQSEEDGSIPAVGLTMHDFLNDHKSDYLPADYGCDFWDERHQKIGEENITYRIPVPVISDLVGVANGTNGKASVNDDGSSGNSNHVETRSWHMPNVPPRATHLEFIQECAAFKLQGSLHDAHKKVQRYKKVHEYDKLAEDSSDDFASDDDNESYSSGDSCYAPFRRYNLREKIGKLKAKRDEDKVERDSVILKALKAKGDKLESVKNSYDETALVTLGMLVEESMIAALLPLAKAHVARCRSLEDHVSSTEADESKNPFVQWTLPPEQAIVSLCRDSKENKETIAFFPSSSLSLMKSKDLTSEFEKEENHILSWCSKHGFEEDFVIENIDLFQFLIHDPTLIMKQEKSLQYQKDAADVKLLLANACLPDQSTSIKIANSTWPIPEIEEPESDESTTGSS